MSETKFTKGPWVSERELSLDENGLAVIASDTAGAISNPSRGTVAWCSVIGSNSENAEANAALIAAAPDLYEAVEDMLQVIPKQHYPRTVQRALSALSRARGES